MEDLEKVKKIGEGSFGEVFSAQYLGNKVAIKKTKKTQSFSEEGVTLLAEAKVLASIPDHYNICRFIGMIHEKKTLAIVTEFVENGSLKDCIKNVIFPVEHKYRMLQQASAGVWNLHRARYVHRDLALRNILIDIQAFRVVVSDFGLSRFLTEGVAHGTQNRSLPIAWCAPETLSENRAYSNQTDVWSFGVMAWELMTESNPFEGLSIIE
eukprot:UN31870